MTCCLARLAAILTRLPKSERRVAEYILEHPSKIPSFSTKELAAWCNGSEAAVTRLCKKLEVSGYPQFKLALAAELSRKEESTAVFTDILPGSPPSDILESVCRHSKKAVEDTVSMIELPVLEAAVQALAGASAIDFYGVGNSGIVAQDAALKFLRIGKRAAAFTDPHQQKTSAANLTRADAAVGISYSGQTEEIAQALRTAGESGATTLSITKYGRWPVAEFAAVNIFCFAPETVFRSGAMYSRIAQMTAVDILFSCVASRLYSQVHGNLEKTQQIFHGTK